MAEGCCAAWAAKISVRRINGGQLVKELAAPARRWGLRAAACSGSVPPGVATGGADAPPPPLAGPPEREESNVDLKLEPGSRVRVVDHAQGGTSELDGALGVCASFHEATGKWEVLLANGGSWMLKSESLQDVRGGQISEPSPASTAAPGAGQETHSWASSPSSCDEQGHAAPAALRQAAEPTSPDVERSCAQSRVRSSEAALARAVEEKEEREEELVAEVAALQRQARAAEEREEGLREASRAAAAASDRLNAEVAELRRGLEAQAELHAEAAWLRRREQELATEVAELRHCGQSSLAARDELAEEVAELRMREQAQAGQVATALDQRLTAEALASQGAQRVQELEEALGQERSRSETLAEQAAASSRRLAEMEGARPGRAPGEEASLATPTKSRLAPLDESPEKEPEPEASRRCAGEAHAAQHGRDPRDPQVVEEARALARQLLVLEDQNMELRRQTREFAADLAAERRARGAIVAEGTAFLEGQVLELREALAHSEARESDHARGCSRLFVDLARAEQALAASEAREEDCARSCAQLLAELDLALQVQAAAELQADRQDAASGDSRLLKGWGPPPAEEAPFVFASSPRPRRLAAAPVGRQERPGDSEESDCVVA